MFPKIILRLIDASILPSLLVFSAKFLSLFILVIFWKLPYDFSGVRLVFQNPADFYRANSLSNTFLFIVVSVGLYFSLFRLHFLTASRLSPAFSAKIVEAELEGLVTSTVAGYIKAAVWLALSSLVALSLFTQGLLGFSSFYPFAFQAASVALGLFILILSLERHVQDGPSSKRSQLIIEEVSHA